MPHRPRRCRRRSRPEAAPRGRSSPKRRQLRERLGKTRAAFAKLRGRSRIDDETWEDLEDTLLLADVGMPVTERILGDVQRPRRETEGRRLRRVDGAAAHGAGRAARRRRQARALTRTADEPNVWMFVGVNGVGKTTTIAKVAQRETDDGHRVVLAAADTFRAAAAEQLTHWAEVTGAGIVRGQEGADPGSVVYDAMSSAASRDADLVLVDTAGRLHTKTNLMAELEKLRRIVDRTPGALKEVLLVLDATTGQNGLTQARQFAEAVDVTGVVLTKLDGTAKGGIVLAIEAELGIPVKLIGVGESSADLDRVRTRGVRRRPARRVARSAPSRIWRDEPAHLAGLQRQNRWIAWGPHVRHPR